MQVLRLFILLMALGALPAWGQDLTDDQEKLIGFMGRLACISERDGHDHDWEWQRTKQFLMKSGSYNEELGRFSWQPAVLIAVEQVKNAMKEENCKSVNVESQTWKKAVHMTANIRRDGSPTSEFFD